MLRNFFSALGVIFMALVLFSASFLVNVALGIDDRRADYESHAIDVTRELSRSWKFSAVEHLYTAEARAELSSILDADIAGLKQLGALLSADAIDFQPRWSRPPADERISTAFLADRLAALAGRAVTVSFVAKFAGGKARVTAELKQEGGTIQMQRLRIETQEPPPASPLPERRVISHA
jgi:hypothetical protein